MSKPHHKHPAQSSPPSAPKSDPDVNESASPEQSEDPQAHHSDPINAPEPESLAPETDVPIIDPIDAETAPLADPVAPEGLDNPTPVGGEGFDPHPERDQWVAAGHVTPRNVDEAINLILGGPITSIAQRDAMAIRSNPSLRSMVASLSDRVAVQTALNVAAGVHKQLGEVIGDVASGDELTRMVESGIPAEGLAGVIDLIVSHLQPT